MYPSGTDRQHFAGKPIKLFTIEEGIADPLSFAYNIYSEHDFSPERSNVPTLEALWDAFLRDPCVSQVSALVMGGDYYTSRHGASCTYDIERLIAGREQLSALKALFVGGHGIEGQYGRQLLAIPDISPLLLAYPQLEVLRLHGLAHDAWVVDPREMLPDPRVFKIGTISSEVLHSLSISIMALNHEDLDDIRHSHLPALEHLEFWLERTLLNIRNFTPLFSGELFPHLRHLTIYLCQFADELAMALAASPLLQRLKVLDLSLGNFSDRGAAALLASPAFRHLEKLKVQHHYCSDKVVRQLQALPMDVEITDQQQWHISFAAGRGPIAHWDCYD